MSKVKVSAFSVSLDGFGAGPNQDLSNPLGVGGFELHAWFMNTEAFAAMHQSAGGSQGVDNDFAARSFHNVGAWILGRNMFGPIRGSWRPAGQPSGAWSTQPNDRQASAQALPGDGSEDDSWKGWWGEEPPYHVPVFVLTHHARPPLEMKGGTTFHFVTNGADSALQQAKQAANGRDVRIGGGVSTIRQYLSAGQIDELHLALSPVLLGEGEHLLTGLNLPKLGFKVVQTTPGERATHFVLKQA